MTTRRGDSTKITGITPKFYIKDDGTDYDTGEEYNGLWSGGLIAAPVGYASIGHWKFNEEDSVIMFNNRFRGINDLRIGPAGGVWSSDAVGKFLSFRLPGNEPLVSGSNGDMYIMLGTGGSYNENSAWGDYLQNNAFEDIYGIADTGKANLRIMFDVWAYFRKPPQNDTDQQVLFCLYDSASSYSRVMTFCIRNVGGEFRLVMYYTDGDRATRTTMYSVQSKAAADAIYPGGLNEDGGLHHVGFIFDRESLNGSGKIKFSEDSTGPEGLYVDGKYYVKSTGNTNSWSTALQEVDTNAIIGCSFSSNTHTFGALKGGSSPAFVQQLTGKIYQISLTVIDDDNLVTKQRMQILHGLKFNIPRAPSKVDFSERYEYKGENLLTELGNIKQALEKDKGSFFITAQTLKVRN